MRTQSLETTQRFNPTTVIKAGWGFFAGQNFARAQNDMPIQLAPHEYAKPGDVIGYIEGNPQSSLGFLRHAYIRVSVPKRALGMGV